ncbi:SMP-30/gluconolactonase/LRE family protein [Microbacterium sulfonylureivorans]|uniref:SMP-30/gluconolactonase/LRE family protein n=1 Tax=Microbacterium sulfonylureivorans TaxID=2486854 RepID=UPI000FD9993F|nr:SMP-30/gluconolactonase/LRE family protein [Microbacterium sulfonylureivorans]
MIAELRLDQFSVIADGLDHPEGIATGPDGTLYAGGEAGQIYRITESGHELIASTGGFVLGLCLDAASNIYACDMGRQEVVKITPDGTVIPYSSHIAVPNYPVFTQDGHLFVSDSGAFDGHDGRLWVIAPDGRTEPVNVDLAAFPNGLAIAPDGDWLYVVLSNLPGVARVRIEGGRVIGEPESIVELPADHLPDGIAFTAAGDLLIACYAPDVIYRWDGATLRKVAEDPRRVTLAAPTNLAFFGGDRSRLAVSSLGRWHIAATDAMDAGARLRYPNLSEVRS